MKKKMKYLMNAKITITFLMIKDPSLFFIIPFIITLFYALWNIKNFDLSYDLGVI